MKIYRVYRFPIEPSIVGFIFLAAILGIFTSGYSTLFGIFITLAISFHLILTIDSIYNRDNIFEISAIYALATNSAIFLILSLQEYEILFSIIPSALLTVLTLASKSLLGRNDIITTIVGSMALTSLVLPASAISGDLTFKSFSIWIIYTLYILISILYVESKINRINILIPPVTTSILIPIFYILNEYYIILLADPLAKSLNHLILRSYIDPKEITGLGKSEMVRLLIFAFGALVITLVY